MSFTTKFYFIQISYMVIQEYYSSRPVKRATLKKDRLLNKAYFVFFSALTWEPQGILFRKVRF